MSSRLRLAYRLMGLSAMTALAAIVAIIVGWFLLGGRLYSVQTSSMQPVINQGDAVLVWPSTMNELLPGHIVSFSDKTQPELITTHRIVDINMHTGTITTQGDDTTQQDLPISQQQVIGRAVGVAPYLGTLLSWIRSPLGLIVAVYIPAAVVIFQQLAGVHRRTYVYKLNKT